MGTTVKQNATVQAFAGFHWLGFQDILQIANALILERGGWLGTMRSFATFLFSQPWLSLLIFVPWVMGSLRFWMVILPLVFVHSLIEGPNHLWNYYSAPFLGTLWFCGISADKRFRAKYQLIPHLLRPWWALLSAFLLGNSSIHIQIPTSNVDTIRAQVRQLAPCLGKNGLVASSLIGLVPLDQVWTDRIPTNEKDWSHIDYVLLTPKLDLFSMTAQDANQLISLLSDGKRAYRRVQNCEDGVISANSQTQEEKSSVVFFIKKTL
jgi:hypothetical protein